MSTIPSPLSDIPAPLQPWAKTLAWRDLAALNLWVDAGPSEDLVLALAMTAYKHPGDALEEIRAVLPCACRDDEWFEHGVELTDPETIIGRCVDLLKAADESCREPMKAPRYGHAYHCRKFAIEVLQETAEMIERQTVFAVVCHCGAFIKQKAEVWSGSLMETTHGMCPSCYAKKIQEIEAEEKRGAA